MNLNKTHTKFIVSIFMVLVLISIQFSNINALSSDNDYAVQFDVIPYSEYSKINMTTISPIANIKIAGIDFTFADYTPAIVSNLNGLTGDAIISGETGLIEWDFDIPNEGMYNIEIKYCPMPGKGSSIERELLINGKYPFNETKFINFSRVWKDKSDIFKTDSAGNQLRPTQVEQYEWVTKTLDDPNGYSSSPLKFHLDKGIQKIALKSIREPMAIEYISIRNVIETPKYSDYHNSNYDSNANKHIETIEIAAEKPLKKSSFSIFPYNDSSSGMTKPQDPFKIKLNCIGGNKWQTPGQWITWRFPVVKSGYYWIVPRFRQNIYDGIYVTRKVKIDGVVPFKEAEEISFKYSSEWQTKPLGKDTKYYEFYLEKGMREITMEVVLGQFSDILGKVESSIYELNSIYRDILMITGSVPDIYRDYGFDSAIPETIKTIKNQADILKDVSDKLVKVTGKKGEYVVMLDKVVFQLMSMYNKPETIAQNFTTFKSNIGALGTWILTARQQPLELDYISVIPTGNDIPKAEGEWVDKFAYSIKTFFASFLIDYNEIGKFNNNENSSTIDVWVGTGRDQAQIIKALVDDSFTVQKKVNVNLKLVAPGTLLPSVLAGIGPDISLSNPAVDPINYATRKAVVDLSTFTRFKKIATRFSEQSLIPYQYNGGTYALPETVQFPVMFYRKDIFKELKISPPKTWEEFYKIIPEIQKRNMQIGFPSTFSGFQLFLYQMGGTVYNDSQTKSTLDQDLTIDAFKKFSQLFTIYKFPVAYDFANRFRTGEMPLGISDYTVYNQLTVFAPEIKGLWEFLPLPAMKRFDGTLNSLAPQTSIGPTSSTGVMMLKGSKNPNAAWEFIDWWTSDDTQSSFCNEMEVVLGVAAKQPTANVEVMKKLPWTANELLNLSLQFRNTVGTPEVPGGYYIARNVDFAFNNVYNNGANPTKELLSYIRIVNGEIERKRIEFGLK